MGRILKASALLFSTIITMSCLISLMVGTANAQSIPKPAIPQFTVNWVNPSPGNESIEIVVTNQNFTSYIDNTTDTPWNISLFYNVREKAHNAENWTDIYYPTGPRESQSKYTIITEPIWRYSDAPDALILGSRSVPVAAGDQLDFQVEAVIGYAHRTSDIAHGNPWVFIGTESGWSETQTVTIPASSPYPSETVPLPTHHSGLPPENPSLILVVLTMIVTALLAVIILFIKMRRHQKPLA